MIWTLLLIGAVFIGAEEWGGGGGPPSAENELAKLHVECYSGPPDPIIHPVPFPYLVSAFACIAHDFSQWALLLSHNHWATIKCGVCATQR